MAIQRMDHVGVVVDDLSAAIAFFVALGLELKGEGSVGGPLVDRIIGLDGVRSDIAFLQTMHALTGAPMTPGNRAEILKNGVQIFPSMLAAIRGAQKTINLEFYIYWDGEVGRQFAEALAERARAGVAVKIILDAVGSSQTSQNLIDFLLRNGVDLEWYHPLRWYTLRRFNHRTHRKILLVDGIASDR